MSDVTVLSAQSYEYSSLVKQYGHFLGSAYAIKVDGSDFAGEHMAINSINVETSVDKADSFSFEIGNAYDYESRSFNWIDSIFRLGKPIQIDLGYFDRVETSFYGYITSIKYEVISDENIRLIVSGMDKTFKMMKGIKSRSFLKKKHSDIVAQLAGEAGVSSQVDTTGTVYEVVEQLGVSDYHFIQILAEKNNYEAFISGNKLFFRKPHTSPSASVTLKWSENMLSFSREDDLADQPGEINVRSWDSQTKKSLVATSSSANSVGSGKNGKAILDSFLSGVKEYYYSEARSQSDLNLEAAAIFNKRAMKLVSGQATSIGIPELRAGTYVQVEGLDPSLNRIYYIISANHAIDENGYITTLTIGGNVV